MQFIRFWRVEVPARSESVDESVVADFSELPTVVSIQIVVVHSGSTEVHIAMTLQRVIVTRSETRVLLRFPAPDGGTITLSNRKGTLTLAVQGGATFTPNAANRLTAQFTIVGGTGAYAAVTGSGTIAARVDAKARFTAMFHSNR